MADTDGEHELRVDACGSVGNCRGKAAAVLAHTRRAARRRWSPEDDFLYRAPCPERGVVLASKGPLNADLDRDDKLHADAGSSAGPGQGKPGAALGRIEIAAVHNNVLPALQSCCEGSLAVFPAAQSVLPLHAAVHEKPGCRGPLKLFSDHQRANT